MQTINERLTSLPMLLGYDSPAGMAKAAGIDPNTLRKAMQGPSKPSFDTLEAITTRWSKLSSAWLLTGKGDPLTSPTTPFVAGGEVNKQGATVLQPGALEKALPLANMEDMEAQHRPADAPAPAPTNAKEFISGLLKEIDSLKEQTGRHWCRSVGHE